MPEADLVEVHRERMKRALRRRRRTEQRFHWAGRAAIFLVGLTLLALLSSVSVKAFSAFTRYELQVQVMPGENDARQIWRDVQDDLTKRFQIAESEHQAGPVRIISLLDIEAGTSSRSEKLSRADKPVVMSVPTSQVADTFLREALSARKLRFSDLHTPDQFQALFEHQHTGGRSEVSDPETMYVLLDEGTYVRSPDNPELLPLLIWDVPENLQGQVRLIPWRVAPADMPDQALLLALYDLGKVHLRFNSGFFVRGDSNEPELAGVLAAVIGSVMMIFVTMSLAVPIGVGAAIYLAEFSRPGRLKTFLTASINNLAAVPSIVFGLLGAAVLVNGLSFTLPGGEVRLTIGGGFERGWPVLVGIVLALMVLPTIIVSARSALSSVPRSVREAALSVGSSPLQAVYHHVLPRALPGIMTGSIIALAQAIGETAPLLLLGVFAFVGDVPNGLTDRSSALSVLIYQWSTRAGDSWEPLTAAAIVTLLLIMLAMNAFAIWIRIRFDRKKAD